MKLVIFLISISLIALGLTEDKEPVKTIDRTGSFFAPSCDRQNTSTFVFDFFTVHIPDVQVLHGNLAMTEVFDGDVIFSINPGWSLYEQQIEVGTQLTDVSMELNYETSMSVRQEQWSCTLEHWRRGESGWTSLEKVQDGIFQLAIPSREDLTFPEVTEEEFAEAIRVYCDDWIKGPVSESVDMMSSIAVTKYMLKITGTDEDGETVTRLLSLLQPKPSIGC